ncbi:MAG: SDR family NAD(P)-dependent oxidoreductase [Flavobacteriia bacterium]|nr:SDR family NAD(P)-dependent oxidoreductase [Flavobacteriia bacterium]
MEAIRDKYGDWALITGASSGIGRAFSKELAKRGINQIVVGRNFSTLESLKSMNEGVQIIPVVADLSKESGVEEVIQFSMNYDVGIFIASAGFGTSGKFLETSIHSELSMHAVNTSSVLEMTHYFTHRFAQKKKGAIVLLSSIVAFQGTPYASNYAASKAYIQILAEGLHSELKPHGVDVLAVAPGPVKSGFEQRANMQFKKALSPDLVASTALKHLGFSATVYPGFSTRLSLLGLRMSPRSVRVKIMSSIMKGFVSH